MAGVSQKDVYITIVKSVTVSDLSQRPIMFLRKVHIVCRQTITYELWVLYMAFFEQ